MEENRYNLTHSCPQVDEAIGRALPGGAIDLSLSNKANQADVDAYLSNNAADHPHRNLLDNWDFRNPVNQRGQTEYTGEAGGAFYAIDRWACNSLACKLVVADGYITMTNAGTSSVATQLLMEKLENPEAYGGKTVTISALVRGDCRIAPQVNGSGFNVGGYGSHADWDLAVWTGTLPEEIIDFAVGLQGTNGSTWHCKAIKLELGSQQTLAHQDASGNWVLNEIPDYGEQLRRCQRYFYAFDFEDWPGVSTYWGKGTSSTEIELYNLIFPVTMREPPSVNLFRVYDVGSGGTFDVASNGFYHKREGLRAIGIISGMTVEVGKVYTIVKAQFSADL